MLEALIRDGRYGLRMLRKTPGFTLMALATLAIGIGVNTAVFTVVNALLLEPLPYPAPDRLATIEADARSPRGLSTNIMSIDGATFLALRDNASLVDVAAQGSGGWGVGVNMVAQNRAANVAQSRVSAGFFHVLGVAPLMGREFTAEEDRAGGPAVAIISHSLWMRVFDGRPDAVGKPIMLRGEFSRVVGVMPAGFASGTPADVWTPLRPSASGEGAGTNYGLYGRLRSGATWDQASAEVDRIARPVLMKQFSKDATLRCSLIPLQRAQVFDIQQPLLMLWGAVGLVLLIACVNVAGLLIARSGIRTREIATRLALGSGRGAVIRQLLVESGVLALSGGILGVLVGWAVLTTLQRLAADVLDFGYPVTLDARVLGASLALALVTSVVFGLVPALQATRVDLQGALAAAGTRSIAGGAAQGWRRLLVAGEVALALVLLVGSGLLVRTFIHLRSLDPGFDPSNVVTAMVSLQDARYRDPARVNQLFDQTLARLRQQAGVEAAGVTLGLPYTRLLNLGWAPVEPAPSQIQGGMTNLSYVTPGYLEALRLPIRRGRAFTDADSSTAMAVAIVNDEFVRRFYNNQDVVGLHIRVAGGPRQIVGVVGNARSASSGLAGASGPVIVPYLVYVPAAQTSAGFMNQVHVWFSPAWTVRSAAPPGAVVEQIRRAFAAVDPMLPVAKVETMSDVQSTALAQQRFMMSLVAGLGVVALLLAGIGVHGLIASSVSERTREFGIRLALGASTGQLLTTVVGPGLVVALAGIGAGTVASLAAVRLLRAFLWGVTASDPLTFASVIAVLVAIAVAASLVPAWRVLRLDPAATLRTE